MHVRSLFVLFSFMATSAWADSGGGGENSGGYSWIDNQGAGGPDFEWTEPGADATNLELGDDETREVDFPENFRFNFFGETYSSIFICSNGWVTFVPTGDTTYEPTSAFPDNAGPMGMLAPIYTDLNPSINNRQQPNGVWVHMDGDEFLVTWRAPFYGREDLGQVEAQLRLTQTDIINFNYRQIPGASGFTISAGLEATDRLDGVSSFFGQIQNAVTNYAVAWEYDPQDVNRAPQLTELADRAGLTGVPVQFTVTASDEDGDTLRYSMSPLEGAEFNTATGLFRWIPQPGQEADHVVTFTVTDDGEPPLSDQQTITISIDRPNSAPEVTSQPPQTATVGEQYIYQIVATDPDGDTLEYLGRNNPDGVVVSRVTGLVTWTPTEEQEGETFGFRVIVRDNNGGAITHLWEVAVGEGAPPPNGTPVFTSVAPATAIAGVQYVYDVDAVDPDGDAIVYSLGRNNCPNGSIIDAGTGVFRYTPTIEMVGETFSCRVRATDANNGFNVQVFNVTVQPEPPPPNEAPQFTTQPPLVAVVGGTYAYDADAVDPEGTAVVYSLDQGPTGSSVMANSGLVRWNPNPGQAGNSYQFVLTAEDGDNFRNNQTWFVEVDAEPNNRPLVTSNPNTEAYVGLLYQYVILATDPDGDVVNYELLTAPDGTTMDPNGRVTWTPGAALGGTLQFFRVRVSDNRGASLLHEWNVLVSSEPPANIDPVIVSSPNTLAQIGQPYTYDVVATDGDGDPLDYRLITGPNGAELVDQQVRWTPQQADNGLARTFVVEVSDGQGGSSRQQWLVVASLDPGNNPPVFTSQPNQSATVGEEYRYGVTYNDPDGDSVTLRLVGGPAGVNLRNDTITWTPGPQDGGQSRRITLELTDSRGSTAQQVIDIEVEVVVANEPPTFTSQPEGTAFVDEEYVYRPQGTDPEGGFVTILITTAPAGARLDGGLLTWTPGQAEGGRSHAFELVIRDPQGAETSQAWQVFVDQNIANRAPTITSAPVIAAQAGEPYTYQVTADDPDGDAVVFIFPDDNPPPEGMQIDNRTGLITWTPTEEQGNEAHRVVVVAADDGGLFDAQIFDIGVGVDANDPPKITSSWPIEVALGNQYVYTVVAVDPDGNALRYFTDEDRCPEGMVINMMTGRLTWMPSAQFVDTTVSCLLGVVDTGDLVDLQTISFRVVEGANQNSDPIITSSPNLVGSEGQLYAYNVTASDPDGDNLTYALVNGPNGARLVQQGPVNGIAWLVPEGTEGESFAFEIVVRDGNGGSVNQNWTVTVGAGDANQPPVITSSPGLAGAPGLLYQYQVQAFDLDQDDLSYALLGGPVGATMDAQAGTLRWTPTEGQQGQSFAFRIEVRDENDGTTEQSWTVAVTGEPPPPQNRAPVIVTEPPTEAEVGVEYRYAAEANDPDGDPLFWILPEENEPPEGMVVDAATGLVTWTPGDELDGRSVAVTLAVWDGVLWDAQIFQIGVGRPAANTAPSFTSSPPNQATAGQRFEYQAQADDPDGDPIFYAFVDDEDCPFEVNTNTGLVTWSPSNALIGQTLSCILMALDPGELADTQAISLTVTDGAPANNPPVIVSEPQDQVTEGQTYRYDARAEDEDGDPFAWSLTAGPPAAVIDRDSGLLVWTPSDDELGSTVSFAIEVTDGRGGVYRQNWNVSVVPEEPLNEAPVIQSEPGTNAVANQAYRYEAIAVDPNQDILSWRLLESPRGVELNASTGVLVWIPSPGERGEHVFQLEVSDGQASARQRWVVVVSPPVGGNNPPAITTNPRTRVFLGAELSQSLRATDPDGDPLSWRLVTGPASALLEDRRITWTPRLEDLGASQTFAVEVSDGRGGTDVLTWQVEVPNRGPTIDGEPVLTAQARQSYRYRPGADDPDEGDVLTWVLEEAPSGMTVNASTGQVQWVPTDEQANNVYIVILAVIDSQGASDRQSWELGVDADPGNRAPEITSRAVTSVIAGEVYLYLVTARDADDDRITFSLTTAPAGMSIDPSSGTIRWNVPLGLGGESVSFTVRVDDGNGLFDEQNTLLTVENPAVNQAPSFGAEPDPEATVGERYEFRPRVRDGEGDAFEVELVQGPPSADCSDSRCNTLSWIPTDVGRYRFKLVARDSEGNESELAWEVTVTVPEPNGLPYFTSSPETIARIGELYEYSARANDPDRGDVLAYSLAVSPPAMTIDGETGEIRWEPTRQDLGFQEVVVQVSDGKGGTATQEFELAVIDEGENAPPQITSIPSTEAYPTLPYSYQVVASDDDGDPLVFELKDSPDAMEIDENQLISWTPSLSEAGTEQRVVIEVTDGALTDTQSWLIVVAEEIPEGPLADAGPDQEVDPGIVQLDGSASRDPFNGLLSFAWSLQEGPETVEIASPAQAITTVDLRYPGEYVFKLIVTATDAEGEALSAEDSVTISVRYAGPIVDAGPDTRVSLSSEEGQRTVALDGTASTYQRGSDSTVVFKWEQIEGPGVVIEAADTLRPSFIATEGGSYGFQLTIAEEGFEPGTDTVMVTVRAEQTSTSGVGEFAVPESPCGCAGSTPWDLSLWALCGLLLMRRRRWV